MLLSVGQTSSRQVANVLPHGTHLFDHVEKLLHQHVARGLPKNTSFLQVRDMSPKTFQEIYRIEEERDDGQDVSTVEEVHGR